MGAVLNYLAGPRAMMARHCQAAGTRMDGVSYRLDGVLYHSTDPLEALSADLLETEYANVADGPEFIPVTSEVDEGAETYSYVQVTDTGEARPFANRATDIPRVSVETEKFEHPVIPVGVSYHWTTQDAQNAALAVARGWPVNLPVESARAANRANARAVTKIAFIGIPGLGVSGLANEPTVTSAPLPNGAWDATATTPEEIYEDLVYLVQLVRVATLGVRAANTILLGTAAYTIVEGTKRTSTSDETLKQAIESAFRVDGLEIRSSAWLDSTEAGAGGTAIAYQRDPDVARQEIPVIYNELPPQEKAFLIEVYTESKCTGTIVRRPAAVAYGTGVLE
jgi:hypothetical protein